MRARHLLVVSLAVAGLAVPAALSVTARAQAPFPKDAPSLILAYQRTIQRSALKATCNPDHAAVRRPRIDCDIHVVNFWRDGSTQSTSNEVAAIEGGLKKPGAFARFCQEKTPLPLKADPGDAAGKLRTAADDACKTNDPAKYTEGRRAYLQATAEKACKVQLHDWRETFEQQDANTWTSRSGPRGACQDTYVSTIWRDPKQPLFWNYKQVQLTPENPPTTFGNCKAGEIKSHEFRWESQYVDLSAEMGCKFFLL